MSPFRFLVALVQLALLLALTACGGDGENNGTPPDDIGTLAYVVTECRDTQEGFSERQTLHILHGDQDVTVMETPDVGPLAVGGLCRSLTLGRFGTGSISREALQAQGVSADGVAVVFEATDDFSINPRLPLQLPPQQKGIFFVRADGSGLRSLGPASRLPFFYLRNGGTNFLSRFRFSPDGRLVTFADIGPDTAGNEAGQVVTLDIGSGQRFQVTHLPPAVPPAGFLAAQSVCCSGFIDNQTIGFFRIDPEGNFVLFTVRSDGSEEPKAAPVPVTLPGSSITSTFVITGKPAAFGLYVKGQPQNDIPGYPPQITEVFAVDGTDLLQLTNFQRVDTASGRPIVDVDRQSVYFVASADPFGTNPTETCQIFSVDRLGGNLRQLTQFSAGQHTTNGCYFRRPPGCGTYMETQDPRTRLLIFYSSCDPLGTNPFGAQIFAMRPDGSGLRQLTHTQGVVTHPGVELIGELPGPFAYGPYTP